jgi:tetratricopeptide (TPR) repeat protein
LGVTFYLGLGQYQEAAHILERAVQRDSTSADAHYWLGRVYLDLDRSPQALATLKKAVDLAPQAWQCRHWLGVAYMGADRLAEAVAAFEGAVNLAHWEPRPHLHLSRIYRALGRAESAQRQQQHFDRLQSLAQRAKRYQLQVEAYPEDARAHSNLAMAYGEQGRLDEALDYFRRAIDIDPHYGRAHYGMATVF